MKKFIALALFLISPVASIAGFPEGESGYDLEKLEKSNQALPKKKKNRGL